MKPYYYGHNKININKSLKDLKDLFIYHIEFYNINSELKEIDVKFKTLKKNISNDYEDIYQKVQDQMELNLKNDTKKTFNSLINLIGLSNIDYVFTLTKEQMPVVSMCKNKEMIPNKPVKFDEINYNHNITFELITSYELLGCFSIMTKDFIDELKDNNVNELQLNNGKKLKTEKLLNRKIIFICEDLIDELSDNISKLQNDDKLRNYFNLDKYNNLNEIKKFFKDKDLLKFFVFCHELGHAVFEPLNISNLYINERQANYYASLCFDGKYDDIIEIFNNKIGKHYKNPLLLKHKNKNNYYNEIKKLYGEEEC